MKYTKVVRMTNTADFKTLGSADQRTLNNIKRITRSVPELFVHFAEPVFDADKERISWHTTLPGASASYSELNLEKRAEILEKWKKLTKQLKEISGSLSDADRIVLGNIIQIPNENSLYLVGDELLVTEWSYREKGYRPSNINIAIDLDPETPMSSGDGNEGSSVKEPPDSTDTSENTDSDIAEPRLAEPSEEPQPTSVADEGQSGSVKDEECEQLKQSENKFWWSLWFWVPLFFVLCVLNWFLMIDACGVQGIQFLNFCETK